MHGGQVCNIRLAIVVNVGQPIQRDVLPAYKFSESRQFGWDGKSVRCECPWQQILIPSRQQTPSMSDGQLSGGEVTVAGFVDVPFLGPQQVVEPDAAVQHRIEVIPGKDYERTH